MRRSVPSINGLRWCAACKLYHPITEFGRDKRRFDGFTSSCKKVISERNKRYHAQHKNSLNLKHKTRRAYRKTSIDRILWIKKRMISDARFRSQSRKCEFNISIHDFEIPEICPVFGFTLNLMADGKRTDNSPSLDRIDNNLGYILGNVWVISWKANNIKRNFTAEELRQTADAINIRVGKKAAGHLLDGQEYRGWLAGGN